MKSKKIYVVKLPTKNTKKNERCKKPYLFINILGTISFLLSAYLLKNSTNQEINKVVKEYKNFIGDYCTFLKECRIFNGCYLGSSVQHIDFSEKVKKYNTFKSKIAKQINNKRNITFRKYTTFINLLLNIPNDNSSIKIINSDQSIKRYKKFMNNVENNPNRPFMIGFSFVQSLFLMSPYFLHFKILTAYKWNIERNNYFISLFKKSIKDNQNAYIVLPCFLNSRDCISREDFRVTIFEIGSIIKSGFKVREIFPNDSKTLDVIKNKKKTFWNYPELFRFFEISKDTIPYKLPKQITLPKEIYEILEKKLSINKSTQLQEVYGIVWLKRNNFILEYDNQKKLNLV